MKSEKHPDAWVIVKFSYENSEPIYRVLAGWYGGYAGSDSWRLNSGIVSITKKGNVFVINGYSGSVYHCHKNEERMTGLTGSIFNTFKTQGAEQGTGVEVVLIKDILERFKK